MFSFIIPGNPVPKERPRFFRGHAFTPKRTRDYEKLVKKVAKEAKVKKIKGDACINISIFVGDNRRRDGGNIAKAIEDSLNGIAYNDDSQIKMCRWSLNVDRSFPRVEINVWSAVYEFTFD